MYLARGGSAFGAMWIFRVLPQNAPPRVECDFSVRVSDYKRCSCATTNELPTFSLSTTVHRRQYMSMLPCRPTLPTPRLSKRYVCDD